MRSVLNTLLALLLFAMTAPVSGSEFDGDEDGVPNIRDLCPNSAPGPVNAVGCPASRAPAPETRPTTSASKPRPPVAAPAPRPQPASPPSRRAGPSGPRRTPAPPVSEPAASDSQAPGPEQTPAPDAAEPSAPRLIPLLRPEPPPATPAEITPPREPVSAVDRSSSITVYFGSRESRLAGTALRAIEDVAARMRENAQEYVTVYGYTPETPDMMNDLALAQARAKDVQRVLVINGVDPQRIELADVSDYPAIERPDSRGEKLRLQRALLRFHQGDF